MYSREGMQGGAVQMTGTENAIYLNAIYTHIHPSLGNDFKLQRDMYGARAAALKVNPKMKGAGFL